MPEPRDPLLKVLTCLFYSSEDTEKTEFWLLSAGTRVQPRARGPALGLPAEAENTGRFTVGLGVFQLSCNDPSAGSPTETLLRLLLPLDDQVWITFRL